MKAFVTGGTGFIGRHVVRKLLERGYDVHALSRTERGAAELSEMGAQAVRGDITDVDSMRDSMEGSDVVFHIAGWYRIGARDWMNAETINVAGTRKVLRLAHELGIPKIVYTSTVAVFGDTKGQLVDESFYQDGPFLTEYDRTKWLAHYKVAVPLIEKGAPIIIVMPGVIYGPGDTSWVGDAMRLFYGGRVPFVPGPELTLTYAHVEDIAEGHILATEKGEPGESYVLAGPAVPLGEMVDFWAQITGRPAPILRIPARMIQPFGPVVGALAAVAPPSQVFSEEAIRELGATYMARADKARTELGWRPRSLHDGMTETFAWIAETMPAKPAVPEQRRRVANLALSLGLTFLVLWLLARRRRK